MDSGHYDFFDFLIYASMTLTCLILLARTFAPGSHGAGGPDRLRSERPVHFWICVALLVLFLGSSGWMAVVTASGAARPGPAGPLLLIVTGLAAQIVQMLVSGFVSSDNRYFRRVERTVLYWLGILFFSLAGAALLTKLLERWP